MISYKNKCIFLHIPKCAGTSIELLLFGSEKKWRRWDKKTNFKSIHGHPFRSPHSKFIANHPDYFVFTSVRNPWDRAVSTFFYSSIMSRTKRKQKHRMQAAYYEMNSEKPFQNFVKDRRKLIVQSSLRKTEWIQQSFYFRDGFNYDKVIRFENFETDVKEALNEISINFDLIPKRRVNEKTKGVHYSTFYDDETINIIGEIYKKDIDLLGYSFQSL